ncbi:MAG: pentapeptide repeat-containing protein [Moorea sp. SIO1G6]|uniref:pentapeptide repeat-containing protein n=1 Tax=Moorena sp. SIO1G6 TaxID=2607840 RepID=UPI0013C047AE|nr:pentapeptide repeat-containing protein [Moorena sp. SIO1G6]NET64539.1 pentapeptide repeat-containing protein [Moorena sp. SIO1G6]
MSSPREGSITIALKTNTSQSKLLEALALWQELGLLSETSIDIIFKTKASHPALLEGLDAWLRLGLLQETFVKRLCREHLTCALPEPSVTPKVSALSVAKPAPQLVSPLASNDFAPETPKPKKPNWIAQMWQSLQAEFSVRWLLFLGMFMVVVSSGVLAASQWDNFPAAGQYGVLLAYTLSFWGISAWTTKQGNLPLTAQTLRVVSLLLIPVNFWAMDGFGLWRHPLNWLVVAVATVALSAIVLSSILLGRGYGNGFLRLRQQQSFPLPIINYLGLSYLNWGWGIPGFPIGAVYLGIGSTIATLYIESRKKNSAIIFDVAGFRILVYGIGILLFRAIFVIGVDIEQLGLAIGMCGWFLYWLYQKPQAPSLPVSPSPRLPMIWLGGSLLVVGWLVCVAAEFPWQAMIVSGLGVWLFVNRLLKFWRRSDLAAMLAIGLQMVWLSWRLIPPSIQTWLLETATTLTHSQETPYVLLSLVLFPYLVLIVGLADWLYQRKKHDLAEFAEVIALGIGVNLTTLCFSNPLLLTINGINSAITLGIVTQRRDRLGIKPHLRLRVYLTHSTAIATVISAINYLFPNLHLGGFSAILLALMVAEWSLSLKMPATSDYVKIWRESAWHLGLSLAGLSYLLLCVNYSAYDINPDSYLRAWGLLWLITPLSLTGLARGYRSWQPPQDKFVIQLSVVAVILSQLLILGIPGMRLISLASATALMLVNTRYLKQLTSAAITVGCGISLIGFLLWDGIPSFPQPSGQDWWVVGAIAILTLWLSRSWLLRVSKIQDNQSQFKTSNQQTNLQKANLQQTNLQQTNLQQTNLQQTNLQQTNLPKLYAQAMDGWAIALFIFQLILLTCYSLIVYIGFGSPTWFMLIVNAVTLGAIAYRSFPYPSNWAIYGMGWSVELLTTEALGLLDHPLINLAVANTVLGLIAQLLGDWWRRRSNLDKIPSSWHIIPLLYGSLGPVLSWGSFTNWTGLYSFALATIAIGVGRRLAEFKPLIYLALFGVSVSAYQLLFYQLSQLGGGAKGDGLIIMAVLGTSIMYAYRVLSPWLKGYLHFTPKELKVISHLHWVWSSCLLIAATTESIESGMMLGFSTGAFLVIYAISQGRNRSNRQLGEIWVYLGFAEAWGMRLYWINTPVARLLSGPLVPWKGAIASLVAYFLYFLPWENWGWSKRPWQIAAFLIPLIAIAENPYSGNLASLVIIAAFYIILAIVNQQIRFTFISVVVIDWMLLRWFGQLHLTAALWYVLPLSLSLLYIAQVDPYLSEPPQKQIRHNLRLIGTSIICLVSFWTAQWLGLLTGGISVVLIFAGLAMKVRAFLYVGTGTFLINAIYQLLIFSFDYPFSKWVVALFVGIGFIWIAATFETRRDQITAWMNQFQSWE